MVITFVLCFNNILQLLYCARDFSTLLCHSEIFQIESNTKYLQIRKFGIKHEALLMGSISKNFSEHIRLWHPSSHKRLEGPQPNIAGS